MDKYNGDERRRSITLDEAAMDEFLDRAIERATERFYAEVGKSVLRKIVWAVGISAVGLFIFLKSKGVL